MRRRAKPGFLLVSRRELRWLLHDRAALLRIFGVPLFAFVVLTAVFSNPVIRGLGVVVVDADRSDTSRASRWRHRPASASLSAPVTLRRRRARFAPARPLARFMCPPISSGI